MPPTPPEGPASLALAGAPLASVSGVATTSRPPPAALTRGAPRSGASESGVAGGGARAGGDGGGEADLPHREPLVQEAHVDLGGQLGRGLGGAQQELPRQGGRGVQAEGDAVEVARLAALEVVDPEGPGVHRHHQGHLGHLLGDAEGERGAVLEDRLVVDGVAEDGLAPRLHQGREFRRGGAGDGARPCRRSRPGGALRRGRGRPRRGRPPVCLHRSRPGGAAVRCDRFCRVRPPFAVADPGAEGRRSPDRRCRQPEADGGGGAVCAPGAGPGPAPGPPPGGAKGVLPRSSGTALPADCGASWSGVHHSKR